MKLMRPAEAARALGVSAYQVRRWLRDGALGSVVSTKASDGRVYQYIRESDVERFMANDHSDRSLMQRTTYAKYTQNGISKRKNTFQAKRGSGSRSSVRRVRTLEDVFTHCSTGTSAGGTQ